MKRNNKKHAQARKDQAKTRELVAAQARAGTILAKKSFKWYEGTETSLRRKHDKSDKKHAWPGKKLVCQDRRLKLNENTTLQVRELQLGIKGAEELARNISSATLEAARLGIGITSVTINHLNYLPGLDRLMGGFVDRLQENPKLEILCLSRVSLWRMTCMIVLLKYLAQRVCLSHVSLRVKCHHPITLCRHQAVMIPGRMENW